MMPSEHHFAYVVEVDISLDNGPGINEREFIRSLLQSFPGRVTCFVPSLSRALSWTDSRLIVVGGGTRNLISYLEFLVTATRALLKEHRENTFSAFVFRPGGTPLLPVLIGSLTGVPIILKKLGLYSIFGEGSQRSKLKNAVSRSSLPLYRRMIRMAVAADCESVHYVQWLAATFGLLPRRIEVIPNGVNVDRFRPGDPHRRRCELGLSRFDMLVGYVGALSPLRNIDILIRAFAECKQAGSLGLLIVGDGPLRNELEQLAAVLNLGDRVVFTGSIPYADVPKVLQALDVAVDLTAVEMTVNGQREIASYSQKIPQYLSCGVPVIAWRCNDTAFLEDEEIGVTSPYLYQPGLHAALMHVFNKPPYAMRDLRIRARNYAVMNYASSELSRRRVEYWNHALLRLEAGEGTD